MVSELGKDKMISLIQEEGSAKLTYVSWTRPRGKASPGGGLAGPVGPVGPRGSGGPVATHALIPLIPACFLAYRVAERLGRQNATEFGRLKMAANWKKPSDYSRCSIILN
eukprot:9489381-Pyramimonas_sp.AAC.1